MSSPKTTSARNSACKHTTVWNIHSMMPAQVWFTHHDRQRRARVHDAIRSNAAPTEESPGYSWWTGQGGRLHMSCRNLGNRLLYITRSLGRLIMVTMCSTT